jgi:nitrogen-specific signal transduction histidine kinase
LAIVNRIIDSNKGKIKIVSEAGKGTTFILLLPLKAGESATSLHPSFRGAKGAGGIPADQGN